MFDPNPQLDLLLRKLLHPQLKVIDPSLDRIIRLMEALGNPHLSLPPVVHVAGTNGKGSVIAYLRATLKAAGYHVHSYISPHLVRFNERILLDDAEIETTTLTPILEKVLALQNDYPTTFFEATTAAAFLAFSQQPADIILLETGMGGRLDATNIIPNPAVVAITPIGIDHAEFLGDSLAQIAGEKAGIIKAKRPVVVAKQAPDAMGVIEQKAAQLNAPIIYADTNLAVGLPAPSLLGEHQQANAAMAMAVIGQLQQQAFNIAPPHCVQGLQTAFWPARLQPLESGYWRDQLPVGWKLYLDGGHNPHAAAAIVPWAKAQNLPIYLVIGMLENKDLEGYLQHWQGVATQLYAISIPNEKSYSPQKMAEVAGRFELQSSAAESVEAALSLVKTHPVGLVLICGSLYLAGHILGKN